MGQVRREVSFAEWEREGVARYGEDRLGWRFVCPCCGHVAAVREWVDAGAVMMAGFSCIGRAGGAVREALGGEGPGPCNYAGGGLFRMGPVHVTGEGIDVWAMEWADSCLDAGKAGEVAGHGA